MHELGHRPPGVGEFYIFLLDALASCPQQEILKTALVLVHKLVLKSRILEAIFFT